MICVVLIQALGSKRIWLYWWDTVVLISQVMKMKQKDKWSAEEFHYQLPSVAGMLHHSGPQMEASGLITLTLSEPLEPQS